MFFVVVASAQSLDWVPPGTFAAPWSPATVGSAELFYMDGGGAEWLVVRQSGRTLEGSQAFAAVASTGQADAMLLARLACATVAPGVVGAQPWSAPLPAVDDEIEAFASLPSANARELRYWRVEGEDLVELVVSLQDGAVRPGSSGRELLRLQREREERYEQALSQARHSTSEARVLSALRALASSGDKRAPDELAELARGHALPSARALALRLLAAERGRGALAVLVSASGDPSSEVRLTAVQLLGEQGEAARAALEAATADSEPSVREAASAALAR